MSNGELIQDFLSLLQLQFPLEMTAQHIKKINVENPADSICGSGIKRLALSARVSDAVVLLMGKGDVATNPKPSCVFRGQFPCL